jgi:hypothetical protein
MGGYKIPSPKKFGFTPQKIEPQPAESEEPTQAQIKAGAIKTQKGFQQLFEKLKPKQKIWINFSAVMSSSHGYKQFIVGRKTRSKKYKTTSIILLHPGQKKSSGAGIQPRLTKWFDGEIIMSLGDLAAQLNGIYAEPPQKKAKSKAKSKLTGGKTPNAGTKYPPGTIFHDQSRKMKVIVLGEPIMFNRTMGIGTIVSKYPVKKVRGKKTGEILIQTNSSTKKIINIRATFGYDLNDMHNALAYLPQ